MYTIHHFNLTDNQLKKLATETVLPITIRITKENLNGTNPLRLSKAEQKELEKNEGMVVTLTKSKIKFMSKKEHRGGFLPLIPLILGGLAAAGGIAGGAAGIAQAVKKTQNDAAVLEEQKRHNEALEKELHTGTGIEKNTYTLGHVACNHCGGLLSLKVKCGGGLYLRPYTGHVGDGLIRAAAEGLAGKELPASPSWLSSLPLIGSLVNTIY